MQICLLHDGGHTLENLTVMKQLPTRQLVKKTPTCKGVPKDYQKSATERVLLMCKVSFKLSKSFITDCHLQCYLSLIVLLLIFIFLLVIPSHCTATVLSEMLQEKLKFGVYIMATDKFSDWLLKSSSGTPQTQFWSTINRCFNCCSW